MKKEFCRANLTGILYANRPSFFCGLSFPPSLKLSLSTFHSWSHRQWKGVSRVVAVRVDPHPPPKQLMVGLLDVWIWRGDLTLADGWRLSQKVEGVFMIAMCFIHSVLCFDRWELLASSSGVRQALWIPSRWSWIFVWPLVFVISRAWLLEWDCDLKWNEFPSWWCLGFRLLLLFVFCLAF